MKTYSTLKTLDRATEILADKGFKYTDFGASQCECGETSCVRGYGDDYDYKAFIAVCDICGDDERWIDEVFNEVK